MDATAHAPLLGDGIPRARSDCVLHDECFLSVGKAKSSESASRVQRKLWIATGLAFAFMIAEIIGGYLARSVAIMSDAAHMLSDVSAFLVAIFAAWAATQRSTWHYSFGYHRVEILGALISVLIIWMLSGALVVEAVQRVVNPVRVDGKIMFIVAAAGIVFNVIMALSLGVHAHHGHSHCHDHDHDHDQGGDHDHHGRGCDHSGHSHGHGHGHSHSHSRSPGRPLPRPPAPPSSHVHGRGAGDVESGHDHPHAHGHDDHHHDHDHSDSDSSDSGHHHHDPHHNHRHQPPPPAAGAAPARPDSGAGTQQRTSIDIEVRYNAPPSAAGRRRPSEQGQGHHDHHHGHDHHGHDHHDHDHDNINLRGAVLHVLGDLVQSAGVALAGALIWWHQDDPRWYIADPICTFVFSVLVLLTTSQVIRDIFQVLMERAPQSLDIPELMQAMMEVQGIDDVHDLHVWNISTGIPVLTAHVHVAAGADAGGVLQQLERSFQRRGIKHSTVQICNPVQP